MPRPATDDARRIETRQLPPLGGCVGLRWGGAATATLIRGDGDVVELRYRWRDDPGEPWRETMQAVRLTFLPCHLGGRRTIFRCPRCRRRALKLYHHPAREDGFLCRRCGGLVPRAQSEGSRQRALRRIAKLRSHCGGDGDLSAPFPPRPRGMKEQTYRMLRAEAEALAAVPEGAWPAAATANVRLGVRRSPAARRWRPGRAAASRRAATAAQR